MKLFFPDPCLLSSVCACQSFCQFINCETVSGCAAVKEFLSKALHVCFFVSDVLASWVLSLSASIEVLEVKNVFSLAGSLSVKNAVLEVSIWGCTAAEIFHFLAEGSLTAVSLDEVSISSLSDDLSEILRVLQVLRSHNLSLCNTVLILLAYPSRIKAFGNITVFLIIPSQMGDLRGAQRGCLVGEDPSCEYHSS